MNSVEKVKAICKERKIPVYRLEKELGYANGYIGQLKKGTFPDDRLVEIANYLNVTTAYLTGEEQKENPTVSGEVLDEQSIKLMLSRMSDAELIQLIADASDILRKKGEE